MDSSQAAVRLIAERQAGIITRRQALAAGMTDRVIQQRIAAGAWNKVGRGVYSLLGRPSLRTKLAAATAALPAVVSHESAAVLHELGGVPRIPDVTIQHRFSNRFAGVQVHESTDLRDSHILALSGLQTTTVARTLFDLCHGRQLSAIRKLAERAILEHKVVQTDFERVLGEVGRRGRPGTTLFRELVQALGLQSQLPESELERRMVQVLFDAGLPAPTLQSSLPWRTCVSGRVDLLYPARRLIIECDGRRWHSTTESFQRDRQRDNLAQLDGWMVLRFTWEDVMKRRLAVVDQVRRALSAR